MLPVMESSFEIRIGRFSIGLAPVTVIIVFFVLSIVAIISAYRQYRPEWSLPMSYLIIINEGIALLGTLLYGIFIHFIVEVVNDIRRKR